LDYIYLIESYSEHETVYKIGFSKHPEKRLKEIKTGNPNELSILYKFNTKHNRKIETSLKRFYEHKCIDGEWFKLDNDDVEKFEERCKILEKSFEFTFE
jgi:hypothetical protein